MNRGQLLLSAILNCNKTVLYRIHLTRGENMHIATRRPVAIAKISGVGKGKGLKGTVWFYQMLSGVLIEARVFGLPKNSSGFYGFHIHSGGTCAETKEHYDRKENGHPMHSGDLPPLMAFGGRAYSTFITDRFSIKEIIGRTVVIHSQADDFTSQPSGNSGERIACGVIEKVLR